MDSSSSRAASRLSLDAGDFVFIGSAILAMGTVFLYPGPIYGLRLVAYLVACVAYILLAVKFSAEANISNLGRVAYLTLQTLLALAIILLGNGNGLVGLVMALLAGYGVPFLPGRMGYVYGVFLALILPLPYALLGAPVVPDLLTITATYGTAIAFMMFIMYWNRREVQARAEAERLNQELNLANQKLRDLAAQSGELAAAQERNRIAREIHDSLGHHLTTISIQLDVAEQLIAQDPSQARSLVQKARSLARQGLDEVRQSIAALRAGPLRDQPLPAAILALADEVSQTGLAIKFKTLGEPYLLSYASQLTLYRAAQEALTNIHKHAQATQAEITLTFEERIIRLVVINDGPPAAPQQGETGFGLAGLRERVSLLAGILEAAPRPEGGFYFCVEIPAHAAPDPGPDRR